MTTARSTSDARRLLPFRRAAMVILLAFGVALSPLAPAQPAQAAGSSFVIAGKTVTAPNHKAKVAVWTALAQRGKPYVWGGSGPRGYDCSGLMQRAFKRVGVSLPHSSRLQSKRGRAVAKSNLRPGDLVFFYRPVSHVAMYIGNGRIVHAPTRGSVVHVTKLGYMRGYVGARRMV